MDLLGEIHSWSKILPEWQSDAVRRLFQRGELTSDDYDDLYALLKKHYGIDDPEGRVPVPFSSEHLPAKTVEAPVVLKAMRNLQHVNRIAPGQTLAFSPKGITVVYGGNGSGKSGYSRVLKQACRARDQAEDVLTDATNPAERHCIPEATFDIEIGSTVKTVQWRKGTQAPDELSTVAVFDAHCARAYLKEGEAAYLPYGMDIVVNLADQVIPEIKKKLDKEISGINVDIAPFDHLRGETAVGKLISNLGHETKEDDVHKLAALSEAEVARIAELGRILSEVDPVAKAKECELSAQRIKELAIRIDKALQWVCDEAVANLKTVDDDKIAAEETEKAAARILRSGESLLPGTGEQVWKTLFEAARKFSTEVAYPEQSFPYIGNDAVCLLCQQPYADAGERLKRFEKYIQEDAAKFAREKRDALDAVKARIKQANVTFGLDEAIKAELESFGQELVTKITDFEESVKARRSGILEAVTSGDWDNLLQLKENPCRAIRTLAARQLMAARSLKKAADEANKKTLVSEQSELVARQKLKESVKLILGLLERIKLKKNLEGCRKDLDTKPITNTSRNLANKVITENLKNAINEEFCTLNYERIKTKLNHRSIKGKPQYKLLLDLPTTEKLEDILSEGEQRAISIGSFLAELRLADYKGAIVFDDPVSSLDHDRRQRVADRLVREAKHRQVIILTHDTVFLGELLDQIEQRKVASVIHYLEWDNNYPGYVNEGLPWGHQGYKDRIDSLKKNCNKIKKVWPAYPNEDDRRRMCQQYNYLRATIERVIQDVVFNGVVKRYRDWIRVDCLGGIVGVLEAHCNEIQRLHKRCCNITEAHDPASGKNSPVPTPTELDTDIAALEAVIQKIKDARKSSAP